MRHPSYIEPESEAREALLYLLHPALREGSTRRRRAPKDHKIPADADVAQLVEHFTRNEGVPGSIPGVGFQKDVQISRFWDVTPGRVGGACPQYVPRGGVIFGTEAVPVGRPTGHVFRVERARGPVWYAKYRLPDGRQIQKKIGPAWTDRGRPANGYFTKRLAEDWLRSTLDGARRGTLPGMVRTGATFADAAAEWLRYVEHDRRRKPSTVAGYESIVRSELLPRFGELAIESITPTMIEAWQGSMTQKASSAARRLC
jgi:hypothetical protein